MTLPDPGVTTPPTDEQLSVVVQVTRNAATRWQRLKWWMPSTAWADKGWRWRVAELVNKFSGTCWADSVTWALDGHREAVERADSWRGALPMYSNKGCGPGSPDFDRNGCCYCGKLMTPELRAQVDAASKQQATQ